MSEIAAQSSTEQASIGQVSNVHIFAYGTPAGESRASLFSRDNVFMQETVETVTDGALHLSFADDTTLRLGSSSTVILDRFVYDPANDAGEMVTRITKGAPRFISGKMQKKAIRVETPTVVIGVRGTDFIVLVAVTGDTRVEVLEGEVEITTLNRSAAETLIAGRIATILNGSDRIGITTGRSISNDPGLSDDLPAWNNQTMDRMGGGEGGGGDGGGGAGR